MSKINVEVTTEKQRDDLIEQSKEFELKKSLPSSWEEYKDLNVLDMQNTYSLKLLENWCQPTKITKKLIATIKIDSLLEVYNDGWVDDWMDRDQKKALIYIHKNNISLHYGYSVNKMFITLKDLETANLFLKNFERLIKDYYMMD